MAAAYKEAPDRPASELDRAGRQDRGRPLAPGLVELWRHAWCCPCTGEAGRDLARPFAASLGEAYMIPLAELRSPAFSAELAMDATPGEHAPSLAGPSV